MVKQSRIFTGAYILKKNNLDTVYMEEDCIEENNYLKIKQKIKKGANIRLQGEDIKKGAILFEKGKN